MKLCIFSDIHGNLHAFDTAYKYIKNIQADINIFLGDICGYYFDTLACWKKLIQLPNLISILGNHDFFFLKCVKSGIVSPEYTLKYGPAIEILVRQNTDEQKKFVQWLNRLDKIHESNDMFSCCHGHPDKPLDGYLYPDSPLPNTRKNFIFTGHTHYPMIRMHGNSLFCNPGSIGQPRQGGDPSFAVVTVSDGYSCCKLHSFKYDTNRLQTELQYYTNLPPYLSKILNRKQHG